jgi:hypothetical protein
VDRPFQRGRPEEAAGDGKAAEVVEGDHRTFLTVRLDFA